MIGQVSDSELELMKIIWAEGGKALYARIMDALAKTGNHWQKNTVITLLSRLVEKGLLKTNAIGRRNQYTAIVTEASVLTVAVCLGGGVAGAYAAPSSVNDTHQPKKPLTVGALTLTEKEYTMDDLKTAGISVFQSCSFGCIPIRSLYSVESTL